MSTNEVSRVQPERKRCGQWVRIGDEEYKIPPLAFKDIRDMMGEVEDLKNMTERPTPEQMSTVTQIVLRSLQRNYPSLSEKDLDDMLDFGNFYEVLSAVLSVSGFVKKEAADKLGETAPLTGTGSM